MKADFIRLEDCCIYVTDGDHQAPPKAKKGIPFITISNIVDNNLDFNNTMYVPEDYYNKLDNKRKAQKGDILYSVAGSYGIPVYIKNNIKFAFQRNTAILRPDENKVYPKYLYYAMKNRDFYMAADAVAIGSAQKIITLTALRNLKIRFLPLEQQKKIADILSHYDDSIENNQKQIALLEEAARRLYNEWFVKLHFPGYENVKIIDGVPEGWENVTLANIIDFEIGGGWGNDTPSSNYKSPAWVIRGTDIDGLLNGNILSIPFRYHKESNLKSRCLETGDIIFEVSGGSKNVGVAKTFLLKDSIIKIWKYPVICASFCKLMRLKDKNYSQLVYDFLQYLRLNSLTEEFEIKSASSIINYRWKEFLSSKKLLLPDKKILNLYNDISNNLYNQILNSSIKIERLKEARDRLLPKLMNGEIEVK